MRAFNVKGGVLVLACIMAAIAAEGVIRCRLSI